MDYSSSIWWWSDPNKQCFHKVLDHIKTSFAQENDIILLHCEDIAGFEKSIPLTNYFFNVYLVLNSVGDEHTMFLNLKDMIASIELYLGRQRKKDEMAESGVSDEEIVEFYNKYISSFEQKSKECEDKSVLVFKKFLKQNNCLDHRLLLDLCLKHKKDIIKHINGNKYLILGTPSSIILKQFISILSEEKICSVSVETPLNVSLHGSPDSQMSDRIKVVHEYIEIRDMAANSETQSLEIGSATQEYAQDVFLSFLSLLVNSRNEMALSKALISPVINLSHEAFTALKHMSIEKEMPMCQVAISYVTRIRLGGKGYAPPIDCPLLCHLKGLELFVDTLNEMQIVIEEDSCTRPAIKRLINILKKKLIKCGSEKLKDSSIETVAEIFQSTYATVSEILKLRISYNNAQICQGTLDTLYHFINFLNCNYFIHKPEEILSKKHIKRTPINLPPLLGYFRSPDEESSCDTKSSLNEDSHVSLSSVQSAAFPSYFHHSESSDISTSCVNSSTPSKLTFKGCIKENDENSQTLTEMKSSKNTVLTKKNRKRSILGEITNENISAKDNSDTSAKKITVNYIKENTIQSNNKKQSKKEPKRVAKKFKQIEGQGKITSFFSTGQR